MVSLLSSGERQFISTALTREDESKLRSIPVIALSSATLFYTEPATGRLETAVSIFEVAKRLIHREVKYEPINKDFRWELNLETRQSLQMATLTLTKREKKKKSLSISLILK